MRISDWSSDVCSSDLVALDISLGRVVASTSEPMIGAMRLAWWREALERLHLPPVPGEPVLQALAAQPAWQGPDMAAALAAMVDGRSEEHTSELQSLMRTSYAVY